VCVQRRGDDEQRRVFMTRKSKLYKSENILSSSTSSSSPPWEPLFRFLALWKYVRLKVVPEKFYTRIILLHHRSTGNATGRYAMYASGEGTNSPRVSGHQREKR